MQIKSYAQNLIESEVELRNVINGFDLCSELNDVFLNHLLKNKHISKDAATCLRIKSSYDLINELFTVRLTRSEKLQILSNEFGFPPKLIDKVLRRKITSKIRFPKAANFE